MIRIIFFLLLTHFCKAQDYFSGLETASAAPVNAIDALFHGNYFSGVMTDDSKLFTSSNSTDDPELTSYLRSKGLQEDDLQDHHKILNFLQQQEDADDPASRFYYALALLDFAKKEDLEDQVEGMVRLAQDLLEKLVQTKLDDSDFQRKAKQLLDSEFHSSSSKVLEQVQRLLDQGNIHQAYLELRVFLHKNRFKDKSAMLEYEKVLRMMAKIESSSEKAAGYLSEANFIAKSFHEEQSWNDIVNDSSLPPSQDTSSPGPISQVKVNESVDQALKLAKEKKDEEALQVLRQAVLDSNFKAVKPRYYLALQYFKMAEMPEYQSRANQYLKMGQLHLFEARNRAEKDLDLYPENREWSNKANSIEKKEDEITPTPPESMEAKVNQAIRTALELEENSKIDEALSTLQEATITSEGKSAKALYFLAKIRYFHRSNQPRFAKGDRSKN